MAVVDKLQWLIDADSKDFRSEITRADRSLKRNARTMGRTLDGLGSRLRTLKNTLIGVAGLAGLGTLARNFLQSADHASKLARALGEPTERVSTFAFAMERSGASIADVERLSSSLGRRLRQLRDPTSSAAMAAREFGIEIFEADGKVRSIFDILTDTADRVAALDGAFDSAEQGTQIFGRSFTNILPFLEQGGDAIRGLEQRARDLGREVSENTGRAAEDFNDAMLDLKTGAAGAGQAFFEQLLPSLIVITEAMADANAESGTLSRDLGDVADTLVKSAAVGLRAIAEVATFSGEQVGGFAAMMEQALKGNQDAAEQIATDLQDALDRAAENIEKFATDVFAAEETIEERRKRQHEERMARIREEVAERERIAKEIREKHKAQQAAEEAAAAAEERRKAGEAAIETLRQEIATLKEVTGVEQIRRTISSEHFASLSAAHQAKLIQLAEELAVLEKNKQAEEEAAQAAKIHADEMARLGEQVFHATRTEAELLSQELAVLNELLQAGAIDWDTYSRAIEGAKAQQSGLADITAKTAKAAESALADFLFDPFEEGVEGMVRSFADAMRRIIAEEAAAATIRAAFSVFGLRAPAAQGGLVAGFADGGPVRGPGTGTSDSIPARLSNGEFVQPANSTSHYGADFMEAIRRRALPRNAVRGLLDNVERMSPRVVAAPAFAEGGMPAAGGGGPVSVRTVLVDDRANIGDYLKSSEGEKVLVEFLSRNRSTARRIIGG
jgi:DNA segregation ATPase FtsK/SpoIIIE-like protein